MQSRPIEITQRAREEIQRLAPAHGASHLRIAVTRGGCAGWEYQIEFTAAHPGDMEWQEGDIRVAVDCASLDRLAGSILDYQGGLSGAGFRFRNPHARGTCGCGTSFEA
ncbi:iron-sulfur cluster assembly accessory protein [Methylacidimicrobium sp. B4]|uniref:HesB/IscA family protein n=1 Tax=Methylacidimicrobium sp. B4 TaxID=2796139 RepID=UPI001A8CC8A6|nr:iron-sulfur cluster assembly accessory protein [Methylacidimicrobium sp. B4]QSR84293.1 iron-sulfur cluster assembly accessory protein [Methylacidimicrobium sp. B4]